MPLAPPVIDDRRFAQLVEETLDRVPVHTPEWTHLGEGDPGVTLVQLFSFLTESLLYRANLIPERNRTRFLQLLRVPLAPPSPARGLVTVRNERGPATVQTLAADLEVRAGEVPFRTELGLDVLPVEGHVFVKRRMAEPPRSCWTTTGSSTPRTRRSCRRRWSCTARWRWRGRRGWTWGPTRWTGRCGSPWPPAAATRWTPCAGSWGGGR